MNVRGLTASDCSSYFTACVTYHRRNRTGKLWALTSEGWRWRVPHTERPRWDPFNPAAWPVDSSDALARMHSRRANDTPLSAVLHHFYGFFVFVKRFVRLRRPSGDRDSGRGILSRYPLHLIRRS